MILSTPTLVSTDGQEPVSIDEIAEWLRIDTDTDPAVPEGTINNLCTAARQWFEAATDRSLILSTYALKFSSFPAYIEIPYPPVVSITSITYLDVNGDQQTLSSSAYTLVTSRVPAIIEPAYAEVWPATYAVSEAVTVNYTAGAVTELLRTGIKMLVAHWHENRGDGLAMGGKDDVPPAVRAIAWAGGSQRF